MTVFNMETLEQRAIQDYRWIMTLLNDGVLVLTDKGIKMDDQVQTRSKLQTLVDNILEQLPARAILIA